MTRVPLALALMDHGLSAGEAATVIRAAAATIDSRAETIELAVARVLDDQAADVEIVAADYRAAADRMRHGCGEGRIAA